MSSYRIEEIKGPFSRNSSYTFGVTGSTNSRVHIGIQKPWCQPLSANWKDTIPYINKKSLTANQFPYGTVDDNGFPYYNTVNGKHTYAYNNVHNGSIDIIQDVYTEKSVVKSGDIQPDVLIETDRGSSNFFINRAGILEFDCNTGSKVKVTFLKNMPPETIVDVVFEEAQI